MVARYALRPRKAKAMRTSSRVLLSCILLVLVSVGAVHASPGDLTRSEEASLLSSLWDNLVEQVTALWGEKARGGFDPDGATVAPEPPTVPDDGEGRGGFDPDGEP